MEKQPNGAPLATDKHKGGQIATDHWISKGKKKIAIVNGRPNSVGGFACFFLQITVKGFTDALKQRGLSIPVGCNIEVPNYSREDGVRRCQSSDRYRC